MGLLSLRSRPRVDHAADTESDEPIAPQPFDPAALLAEPASPVALVTDHSDPDSPEPSDRSPAENATDAEPAIRAETTSREAQPEDALDSDPLPEPHPEPALAPVVLPDAGTRFAVKPDAPASSEAPAATKVLALANQKGGVAKTTTTLNLGVALKEMGHRVLLIDLDPQGNLTMSQGMNPDVIERSMFDVLVHRIPITEIIEHAEVDIAVASIDLAGAELALSALIGRERALDKALTEVRGQYDYVLIDTPPSLGLLTINAFVAATGVIVPVQCEYLSLRGLVQLENTLAMVRENLNPHVRVEGIVPTMYDGRTLHAREAIEILEENFDELVFKTRIRKTVRYAEAPVKGSSVLKYDSSGSAAEAYRALAREFVAKEDTHGAPPREHA